MKNRLARSIFVRGIILVLLTSVLTSCGLLGSATNGATLSYNFSEPIGDAKNAKVDISTGSGNLTIDKLIGNEQLLASGTLQYFEKLGMPEKSMNSNNGLASLALRWNESRAPSNGAIEWQIYINPKVLSEISLQSGGGNVKLNLADLVISRISIDTSGGNIEAVLPDKAANLSLAAKTGGGNVTVDLGSGTTGSSTIDAHSGAGNLVVRIPSGIAARIHATTGLGKVIVPSNFIKMDDDTYQSTNYDNATAKVEVTIDSGAGNVEVSTK
jgi:predicted membrane protein